MDRRAALQKLVRGGAVVTLSSVVVSQRAFAAPGSVADPLAPTFPPDFEIELTPAYADQNQSQWNITTSGGSPSCASPPPGTYVNSFPERRWTLIDQPVDHPATLNPAGGPAGVYIRNNGAYAALAPLGGGTLSGIYTVRAEVRYVCTYIDNSPQIPGDQSQIAWQCVQIDTTFTITPGGSPVVTVLSQVETPNTAACSSPPPVP